MKTAHQILMKVTNEFPHFEDYDLTTMAMEEYAAQWKPEPPKLPQTVWQRSTKTMPDIWITSTNDDYEKGKHLTKFNWRRKEI